MIRETPVTFEIPLVRKPATWSSLVGLRAVCFVVLSAQLSQLPGCSPAAGAHPTSPAKPTELEPVINTGQSSVQTVKPTRQDLVVKFEQPAPIVAFEQADLFAKIAGYIKAVHVDIGDAVEQHQVLLDLDVPDIAQELAYKRALVLQAEADKEQADAAVKVAEAALVTWQSQLEQAEADVAKAESEQQFREQQARRYANLAARDAAPEDQAAEKRDQWEAAKAAYASAVAKRKTVHVDKTILEAKLLAAKAEQQSKARRVDVTQEDRQRTQVLLDFARLKAPFSGVITRRTVDPGDFVNAGASGRDGELFTLARVDKVIAVLRVPEREVGSVRVGARALIRPAALDGQEVDGVVARFAKSLDEKSRTMRVEIDIANQSGVLYPGMYAPVTLVLQEIKDAITVPASAVYTVGATAYVVQVRNGAAHRIAVKTAYDDGKVVQVTAGLIGDEEVVVSNKGQIEEGQPVTPHRVDKTRGAQAADR